MFCLLQGTLSDFAVTGIGKWKAQSSSSPHYRSVPVKGPWGEVDEVRQARGGCVLGDCERGPLRCHPFLVPSFVPKKSPSAVKVKVRPNEDTETRDLSGSQEGRRLCETVKL